MAAHDLEAKRRELLDSAAKLVTADHFVALGVTRTASTDDVKRAYIDRVKAWHPDRVPAGLDDLKPAFAEVFARLDLARSVLSDASTRLEYVSKLASGGGVDRPRAGSPAEATLELRKAEALLKKRDLVGAEEHARAAVRIAPDNTEMHAFLISIQMAKPGLTKDDLHKLVTQLDEHIKRDDACERAYFTRGQLKKQLEMTAAAVSDFARAAELNPRNVDAAREVRLHTMRREKAADASSNAGKPRAGNGASGDDDAGIGGFFKRLFKR